MNGYKSILLSKTFWGAVVAIFAVVAPHLYARLGITDQAAFVVQIVGVIGGLFAIYGRRVATTLVTLTGNPPSGEPLKRY